MPVSKSIWVIFWTLVSLGRLGSGAELEEAVSSAVGCLDLMCLARPDGKAELNEQSGNEQDLCRSMRWIRFT